MEKKKNRSQLVSSSFGRSRSLLKSSLVASTILGSLLACNLLVAESVKANEIEPVIPEVESQVVPIASESTNALIVEEPTVEVTPAAVPEAVEEATTVEIPATTAEVVEAPVNTEVGEASEPVVEATTADMSEDINEEEAPRDEVIELNEKPEQELTTIEQVAPPTEAGPTLNATIIRHDGSNRETVAINVAKAHFSTAKKVILVNRDAFPDAISATNVSQGEAPVLYTRADRVDQATINQMKAMPLDTIYVLGGTMSVSDAVINSIKQQTGKNVIRIDGANRYEVNTNAIKQTYTKKDHVVLASGEIYTDALYGVSYANTIDAPILLAKKNQITASTEQLIRDLGVKRVTLIGGELTLTNAVLAQLKNLGITATSRISGSNRYTGSINVAKSAYANPKNVIVASGEVFSDALVAAPLAQKLNAPILLVSAERVTVEAIDYLKSKNNTINKMYILGGLKTISKANENNIKALNPTPYVIKNTTKNFKAGLKDTTVAILNQPTDLGPSTVLARMKDVNSNIVQVISEQTYSNGNVWLKVTFNSGKNGFIKESDLAKFTNTIDPKALEIYKHAEVVKDQGVYTQPEGVIGFKYVNTLSNYKGKNIRIVRTANTKIGKWDFIEVDGKFVGWTKTGGLKQITKEPHVFIDAGHGGYETGAYKFGIAEKNINLEISNLVKGKLDALGIKNTTYRTSDVYQGLLQRAQAANASGADFFVSIHHNAAGVSNSGAYGIETYYYPYKNTTALDGKSKNRLSESAELARSIQSALVTETKAYNRGVKTADFAVTRETNIPAVLLELGYMDNWNESRKLINDAYQNKLAEGIVKGIQTYIKNNF